MCIYSVQEPFTAEGAEHAEPDRLLCVLRVSPRYRLLDSMNMQMAFKFDGLG
jgi:hypothetical protein